MNILLGIAMASVVLVLLTGIASFGMGGPWYSRHANHLMNLRVGVQLAAVLLLAVIIFLR